MLDRLAIGLQPVPLFLGRARPSSQPPVSQEMRSGGAIARTETVRKSRMGLLPSEQIRQFGKDRYIKQYNFIFICTCSKIVMQIADNIL